MPPAGKYPTAAAAASESSPAPPAAEGETPPETVEAGVRAREEVDGAKEMEVEDRDEVEPQEATGVESVEEDPDEVEPEEDSDVEEAEEDPEEVEEDSEEAEEDAHEGITIGNEEEVVVLAVGPGVGKAAATESEKVVIKEGGEEDTGMKPVVVEEAVKEDEEPEEAEAEEPEEEEKLEETEEDVMEEDAAKVSRESATVDGTHGDNHKDGVAGQVSANGDAVGCENGDAQNDELDPSLLALGPVSVENAKDLEIFVGGLPKDCVEEDITVVFSQFGDIESIRIIKHPARKKNKCIAFVCYVNTEAAEKALAEFKEGMEVKGKRVRVSASQDNNTLYLGNICKSWTKDQVLNTLKSIGIEEFEMSLPDDPDTGGRNRGFAFLKFATHDNAEAAFQQIKKHSAFSGINGSAKVSARAPTESSEELMKVKTVYLEHFPLSWDKKKIEECCEGYGKIQKVRLLKSKKKTVCFVEFPSRKSALACVEGINNAKIGGEVKLAASLARPRRKIELGKKSAEGGFKVNSGATSKDSNKSEKKKDQKKEFFVKKNSLHNLPKGDSSKLTSQVDLEVPQTSNPSKGKRKAGKNKDTPVNDRPSKRARKNRDVLIRPSNRTHHGGYARASYAGQSAGNMKHSAGPRYATSNQAYRSVGATSRSKPNARDLEPHAGYIPPANRAPANRVQITYVYDQPRTEPSNIHQINGRPYPREIAAPQPAYSVYTSNPRYQGDYAYTYLPAPPPSGSYHPGSGAYSPQRRYY